MKYLVIEVASNDYKVLTEDGKAFVSEHYSEALLKLSNLPSGFIVPVHKRLINVISDAASDLSILLYENSIDDADEGTENELETLLGDSTITVYLGNLLTPDIQDLIILIGNYINFKDVVVKDDSIKGLYWICPYFETEEFESKAGNLIKIFK